MLKQHWNELDAQRLSLEQMLREIDQSDPKREKKYKEMLLKRSNLMREMNQNREIIVKLDARLRLLQAPATADPQVPALSVAHEVISDVDNQRLQARSEPTVDSNSLPTRPIILEDDRLVAVKKEPAEQTLNPSADAPCQEIGTFGPTSEKAPAPPVSNASPPTFSPPPVSSPPPPPSPPTQPTAGDQLMATRDILSCSSTPKEHALPPALSVFTDVNSSAEPLKPPPSAIASLLAMAPISPATTPELFEDTMPPAKGHEPAQENIETVEESPTAQENELVKENEPAKEDDQLAEGEMGFSDANLAEFRLPVDVLPAREHPTPNRHKRRLIVDSDDDEQPSVAPSSLSPPLQCLPQSPQENNSGALQNDTYAEPQASSVSTIDQEMVGMVAQQTHASPDDVKIKEEPDLDRPLLQATGSRKRPGRFYIEAVEVPLIERVKRNRAIPPKEDPKLLADLGWALETTMRPHSKPSVPIADGPQNLGIPSQLVLTPFSSKFCLFRFVTCLERLLF